MQLQSYFYRPPPSRATRKPKPKASLGVSYQLGEGVPQNDVQTIYWFRCSAELGDPNGQTLLGAAYHEGRAMPKNPATAAEWYRRAAEQGNVIAQRQLAILHAQKG
jgi:TPR repeat protein